MNPSKRSKSSNALPVLPLLIQPDELHIPRPSPFASRSLIHKQSSVNQLLGMKSFGFIAVTESVDSSSMLDTRPRPGVYTSTRRTRSEIASPEAIGIGLQFPSLSKSTATLVSPASSAAALVEADPGYSRSLSTRQLHHAASTTVTYTTARSAPSSSSSQRPSSAEKYATLPARPRPKIIDITIKKHSPDNQPSTPTGPHNGARSVPHPRMHPASALDPLALCNFNPRAEDAAVTRDTDDERGQRFDFKLSGVEVRAAAHPFSGGTPARGATGVAGGAAPAAASAYHRARVRSDTATTVCSTSINRRSKSAHEGHVRAGMSDAYASTEVSAQRVGDAASETGPVARHASVPDIPAPQESPGAASASLVQSVRGSRAGARAMLEGDDVSRRRSSSVRGGEFDVDRTAGIGLVVAAAPLQAQQGPASIAAASGLFGAGRLASGSGIVSGVPVTSSRFVEATKFAGVEDILKPVGTTAKTATKDIRAQKKESTVTEAMRAEATIKSAMLSAQVRQRTPSRLIESGVLADFLHNVEGILGPISSEKNGAPNGRGKGAKESGSIAVPDPPPTLPAAVLTATKPVDMLKDKPSLPTVPSNKDLFEIMLKEKRAQRYQGFLDIMGKKTGLPRSEAEKQTFEMQKVNPTRELDVIFMRDFTFLEKRVTDTQINELNQKVIRDMNVFGSIFIRPVKWPALEEMIFNYFRFLRAQRTALIESDLASALVEVVEDDLSMDNILLEFRRLIRQLPRLAALKLKMNFIYLERLATVLEDIPAPLYPGISNLFATLFFRFPNRKNKLHELEKRHGSRANSDFHRSISQTFANEFGSMNSVQNSLTQLRTTSITESVSISIEYPVSERDTVSVKPSGGLLPINSLGGLSPTTSNIPSKHTRRQTSKKFVKGLWVDVESESQNNYGVESKSIPGFRETENVRLIKPPENISIPSASPFAPKTKEELEEIEYELLSAKFRGDAVSRIQSEDIERKARRRYVRRVKAKERWAKLRAMFADRPQGGVKRRFAQLVLDSMTIASNSIQSDTITVDGVVVFSLKEPPLIEFGDEFNRSGDGDEELDAFGWNSLQLQDVASKLFLEQGCATATWAAMRIVLENLNTLFAAEEL